MARTDRVLRHATLAISGILAVLGSIPASALLPLEGLAQVSAGSSHTCALTTTGAVKCWGNNLNSELGDGSTTTRLVPVEVAGLSTGVKALAVGGSHSCALTTAGGVKCWGFGVLGQLGDGLTASRGVPVDVVGLSSGVSAIAAGSNHTCALTRGGRVKCWGWNDHGQLGDNSVGGRLVPVDVVGLPGGIAGLTAGHSHTCARIAGGGVMCWGKNESNQLGDNTNQSRLAPVVVSGLTGGVAAVTAGYSHTCALTTAGGVKCWGDNTYGTIGDGTYAFPRPTPVDVLGLSGVVSVSAGYLHTCAATAAGAVSCWGRMFRGGDHHSPAPVTGFSSGVVAVSTGTVHDCVLTSVGRAQCWGSNDNGQLGDGGSAVRPSPVSVSGMASATAIAAGNTDTCALTAGGGAKCWGSNSHGQVGDNTRTARLTPVDATTLPGGLVAIAIASAHACGLTSGGGVKCWGANIDGSLGNNSTTPSLVPVDVVGLSSGVAKITAGAGHSCALTTGGGVKCWGYNQHGQLGDGSTTHRHVPVDVFGLSSGVAAISGGNLFSCALTSGGGVKCWGYNQSGQLGDNSNVQRLTPVDVAGLSSGVLAIAAGGQHACALKTGGEVTCWGDDAYGQLGGAPAPLTGVTAIAAGWFHTCALTSTNGVKCWGSNLAGQLGDASGIGGRNFAGDVLGLTSGVGAIAAGSAHTCAANADGSVKCWGANMYGQLGDGTAGIREFPADVLIPGTSLTFAPLATTGSTNAIFAFTAGVPGATVECSLDGAAYSSCSSPRTHASLAAGPHTFSVRARDSAGNPDPTPASISWTIASTPLSVSPSLLAFQGQSMNTTSPPQAFTLTNPTGTAIAVTATTSPGYVVVSSTCATVQPGGSCQVSVAFVPHMHGFVGGFVSIAHGAGPTIVDLAGSGERSLVTHYYRSILRRAPDAGGKAFWEGQGARVPDLGASVNETWFAMAQQFYFSPEYAAFNRDNTGFVTDLYNTFFNRAPDAGGLSYWTGQVDSGMPREVLLASFMFSQEFSNFTRAIFGSAAARPEVDTVLDFYRGLLSRLPDDEGFNYWVGRFRSAQCQGPPHVAAEVEAISSSFISSGEYLSRGRSNAQYIGDLYNAFLRRGGDFGGVQFWIAQLSTRTRDAIRAEFRNSPEFAARVSAIVSAGCL